MRFGFTITRTFQLALNAAYCLLWGSVGGFVNLMLLEYIAEVHEGIIFTLALAYALVFLMLWAEYRAAPTTFEKALFAISRVVGWTSVLAILWLNVTALSAHST